MSDYFPLFQKINADRRILIIGGGTVATAKIEALRYHAPFMRVKSLHILPELEAQLKKYDISYEIGAYEVSDLHNIALVIAATNNSDINAEIKKQANAKGILVNCVDDKALCDFIFPALVRRGPLQIAISSAGISPVLARLTKRSIEMLFPENFSNVIDFLKEKRDIVIQKLSQLQPRRLFWENFLSSHAVDEILHDNHDKAETLFQHALEQQENVSFPALYLIGAGCGDPDLMTIKGANLLSRSDVILYDRLVCPSLLERYGRKDAIKIEVGKKRGKHTLKQQQIDEIIGKYLSQNKIVARLKGGDPGIFAHSSEEIEIAKKYNASWHIVPGISAALGCAAYSGFPLTQRGEVTSVRMMTLYEKDIYDDAVWENLARSDKETLVFYMSIHHRDKMCQKLMDFGMDPDMPIIAIEQGTTSEHRQYRATLSTFCETYKDMRFISPTLFIISKAVKLQDIHQWIEKKDSHNKNSFFDYKKEV